MADQRQRYGLDFIDQRTSRDLANAEAALKYCDRCESLEQCQFPATRGFMPFIGVRQLRPNITEAYLSTTFCQHRKDAIREEARRNLIKAANLPGKPQFGYPDFLTNAENIHAIECLIGNAARLQPRFIYLKGAPQTGKTELLKTFGNDVVKAGRPVIYTTATEMLIKLRSSGNDYQATLADFLTAATLIIDDLGQERPTDFALEQLQVVIDYRLREEYPTIVASELSPAQVSNRYASALGHDRLESRLLKMQAAKLEKWSG